MGHLEFEVNIADEEATYSNTLECKSFIHI